MTDDNNWLISGGHAVKPEWIDVYGHMNMARYAALFDETGFALLDQAGLGEAYTRRTRQGVFTVDVRIRYLKELTVGIPLAVRMKLVGVDHVRLHSFLELINLQTGSVAATMEQLAVHASLESRSVVPFGADIAAQVKAMIAQHLRDGAPSAGLLLLKCSSPSR
ncbi:MAG: thioesterase family protein [Polaromonas sp.]|nr:thioesterase family protein [Polaromonas sp.]